MAIALISTMDTTIHSVLLCNRGGMIIPVTSGQEDRAEIDRKEFNSRYQKAMRWAIGNNLMCFIMGRDPINMNTGNFIYEKEDLVIPGITTLSFKICSNSMDKGGGSSGKGWHHNHEMYIHREKNGMVQICRGMGKRFRIALWSAACMPR